MGTQAHKPRRLMAKLCVRHNVSRAPKWVEIINLKSKIDLRNADAESERDWERERGARGSKIQKTLEFRY